MGKMVALDHGLSQIVDGSVAKKMERLASQNTYDDVLQDFRYWDDPSDQFKVRPLVPLLSLLHQLSPVLTSEGDGGLPSSALAVYL